MEDEDFLDAIEADNAAGVEEVKEEPQAQPEPEPAPEPTPEPEPTPLEPPVIEAKPDPGFVPITVVLDERDKRQRAEAELERFRAQQQPPQPVPDVLDDPEGFHAYQDQKLYQINLRYSERLAAVQHGAETVNEAKVWGIQRCDADPYFNAKVAASEDPVGFVVNEWKREQIASSVTPDDFKEFQAWKAAQAQIQAPAQPAVPGVAAPETPSRSIPPKSLASAPSAGGVLTEVAQTDEEIFDEMFSRKE